MMTNISTRLQNELRLLFGVWGLATVGTVAAFLLKLPVNDIVAFGGIEVISAAGLVLQIRTNKAVLA